MLWSMVIVGGPIEYGDVVATFHSNLCVQANGEELCAFIHSHSCGLESAHIWVNGRFPQID
jgi:hypothetical protein